MYLEIGQIRSMQRLLIGAETGDFGNLSYLFAIEPEEIL